MFDHGLFIIMDFHFIKILFLNLFTWHWKLKSHLKFSPVKINILNIFIVLMEWKIDLIFDLFVNPCIFLKFQCQTIDYWRWIVNRLHFRFKDLVYNLHHDFLSLCNYFFLFEITDISLFLFICNKDFFSLVY